jgi:hypothetical protein
VIDKTKVIRPKLRLEQAIEKADVRSVLESIRPTERTFTCQRTGNLVDGGFCALFCEIGREMVYYDPNGGIEVLCPFSPNQSFGQSGDSAFVDS